MLSKEADESTNQSFVGQPTPLARLGQETDRWASHGSVRALETWFARELDDAGAPLRLPLDDWARAMDLLIDARARRAGWPPRIEDRAASFVVSVLRFSRPGGRLATSAGEAETAAEVRSRLVGALQAFPEAGIRRVLNWWLRSVETQAISPPLPAWSSPDRVLGVLRADWSSRGDMLAFDQREGGATRFELFGAGVPWLGDRWTAPISSPAATAARPRAWQSTSMVDLAEWTFRVGSARVSRVAVLIRGRRAALLADQVDGGSSALAQVQFAVPSEIAVASTPETRALEFRESTAGKLAHVIPLALPDSLGTASAGSLTFAADSRQLVLSHPSSAPRAWFPLLLSWEPERRRKRVEWRSLTVSEGGRVTPPHEAWAARARWGRDETFVFYRSLIAPARRSFLGCSTSARMLVGRFTADGDVEPLATLD